MPKLSPDQIKTELDALPGWSLEEDRISKKVDFPTYADAVAAITRVGFAAEAVDHHPDLYMNWKRVTFYLTTHAAGGLTQKDFAFARQIDALVTRK